jgi:hypothetical protein
MRGAVVRATLVVMGLSTISAAGGRRYKKTARLPLGYRSDRGIARVAPAAHVHGELRQQFEGDLGVDLSEPEAESGRESVRALEVVRRVTPSVTPIGSPLWRNSSPLARIDPPLLTKTGPPPEGRASCWRAPTGVAQRPASPRARPRPGAALRSAPLRGRLRRPGHGLRARR